jgi:hypothetical protein
MIHDPNMIHTVQALFDTFICSLGNGDRDAGLDIFAQLGHVGTEWFAVMKECDPKSTAIDRGRLLKKIKMEKGIHDPLLELESMRRQRHAMTAPTAGALTSVATGAPVEFEDGVQVVLASFGENGAFDLC